MDSGIVVIKKSLDSKKASYTNNRTGIEHVFSSNDFHIGKYSLPKGVFLYSTPTEREDLIKSYTVIEGALMELKSRDILISGDVFIVDSKEAVHTLYTLEETFLIIHEQQSPNSLTSASS